MMAVDASVDRHEQRIVDATLRCIGRWGVAKTTLDDVAREAGCSRATVYRVFPGGKDSVLNGLVATELRRFAAGLTEAVAHADDLEDVLAVGMAYAARCFADHQALQFLLAHEPEVVLTRISFGHMREVLDTARRIVAPLLAPFVGDEDAPRAAEWVTRLVLSYALCPADGVDVTDEESVRTLVREFVLPGLTVRVRTT